MPDADANDTPPPHRHHRSDHNTILQVDAKWFHDWREKLDRSIEDLRTDTNNIIARIQDNRVQMSKHDDQIVNLAKDLAATDSDAVLLRARVDIIEIVEVKRSDREANVNSSMWTRAKETALLAGVAGIVGGLGMFVWFFISFFVRAQQSGVTP